MSREERTGVRDLTYSQWHRVQNLTKILEPLYGVLRARQLALTCTMIDLDGVEYCHRCKVPLALIETKHERASSKYTTVLERLSEASFVPAYLVEYGTTSGFLDRFTVTSRPTGIRRQMTPLEYAQFVLGIHHPPQPRCRCQGGTS